MNIFTSLQSWCKILVLVKVQIILITFISSIVLSLQYGLVYKMISRLFGLSGLPALWSGPEWGQEWPIQRGPDPFYILLHLLQVPFTQCPFSPPPLSSSHLKRQYLTGSSSHQIRDITSYCHNVTCTLCS